VGAYGGRFTSSAPGGQLSAPLLVSGHKYIFRHKMRYRQTYLHGDMADIGVIVITPCLFV